MRLENRSLSLIIKSIISACSKISLLIWVCYWHLYNFCQQGRIENKKLSWPQSQRVAYTLLDSLGTYSRCCCNANTRHRSIRFWFTYSKFVKDCLLVCIDFELTEFEERSNSFHCTIHQIITVVIPFLHWKVIADRKKPMPICVMFKN